MPQPRSSSRLSGGASAATTSPAAPSPAASAAQARRWPGGAPRRGVGLGGWGPTAAAVVALIRAARGPMSPPRPLIQRCAAAAGAAHRRAGVCNIAH
eukprot:CAMPEP_0118951206 /NCGR_PEP_ID=MMETSP1169-20130426/52718_1 /TAXON_ID=36882 /ORGANISM="Pyramimonas obovata, Strain CCMP722" /LENGTH=96 /DNA_ID=CAMNT_0006898219 /DNA_START=23 /DNA_END=311 /DNA_ORIENTATION=-